MKKSSPFLYELVHKLTKSEKRYIKVQAGSGEKDYIHLMDALLAQKTFDENQLMAAHKGASFLKHLAVNKRYLYELLLNALANFGQKTLEDKVFEKISAANVLMGKGLFKAAFSELKKGQKIVEKYELFELQIMLCSIEKKLLSMQQSKIKDDSEIHQIFNVEANSLEQLKNTNEYWYLASQVAHFQMRFQKIETEEQQKHIESLIKSPRLTLPLATNFKSRIYFYQANSIYQFMLGNIKEAYEINQQFLDLLETNSDFLKLYAERYITTLNNMLIDSLLIGKYDMLEAGINRLIMIPKRPEFKSIKNIESRIFRRRYLLLINWNLQQKDFKKAMEWIPEVEEGLNQFGKKIEKHYRITFYYLIAYIFFQNRQYEQALQWNNRILNDPKEDVVKEIFYFARILNLLIHYQLENYTLLDALLSSTPKFLKSRRAIYATEKSLFRFFRRVLNCNNKSEKKELFDNFKDEIHTLSQKPTERRVFNYLDLKFWIEH